MNAENKIPDDKTTNDALLCMVYPEYAIKFCKKVPLTEIQTDHVYSPVLFAVLKWYVDNYMHSGEWHTDNLRAPTASEVTEDMDGFDKSNAEDLIAFRNSPECLTRFIANANSITYIS